MDSSNREIVDQLASMTLFGDLNRAQLEAVAHTFDEEWFSDGQRILRQGFTGTGFYVILEGEAAVRIDGVDRATLGKGDFFGDISILLGQPPVADIVALRPLRCLVLGGPELEHFLNSYPRVMYRMLQSVARRLSNATQWRS
jgi:CRP-like cAMP-binding protein